MDVFALQAAMQHATEKLGAMVITGRGKAIAGIRSRTTQTVASWLGDDECVKIALASSLRAPAEVLEFMLSRQAAKKAVARCASLALTPDEFQALFAATAGTLPVLANRNSSTIASNGTFQQHVQKTTAALRCSLLETQQRAAWTRGLSQASCVLALHMHDYEDRLADVLGGVVRADSRRLEDLATEIDESSVQTAMLSATISALSASVT